MKSPHAAGEAVLLFPGTPSQREDSWPHCRCTNNEGCFVAVSPLVRNERRYPGRVSPRWYVSRWSQIVRLEGLFGAMNKDSEVLAVYTKIAAHLIFTALPKEQSLQQAAIFFREFVENLPNSLLRLPQGDGVGDTNGSVGDGIDESVSSRNLPVLESKMLV